MRGEQPRPTLREEDLEETFSLASGPGGQNVNKVATRVTLRHRPTGLTVSVQSARTQAQNRRLARERLAALIAETQAAERAERRAAREKKRRQNSPRPPRVKKKILEGKRRRAETKAARRRIDQ